MCVCVCVHACVRAGVFACMHACVCMHAYNYVLELCINKYNFHKSLQSCNSHMQDCSSLNFIHTEWLPGYQSLSVPVQLTLAANCIYVHTYSSFYYVSPHHL